MNIGFSTRRFSNQRLSSHLLDCIHKAGIPHLEVFAAREHLDYHDVNQVRDVGDWFKDNHVKLNSLHAPLFADLDSGRSGGLAVSPSYTERRLRIESMDELKRTLDAAERLPFSFLVLHLARPEDEYDLRKFDAAFTSLEHLRIFAKEHGIQILLENTTGDLNTPARLVEFIQYTRLPMKVCFDVGHAHLTGGVLPSLEILKPYVATVHLHDNRQENDDHLMPFEGSIDWKSVVGALRTLGPDPSGQGDSVPALIELHDQGPGIEQMDQVQEANRKLNEL